MFALAVSLALAVPSQHTAATPAVSQVHCKPLNPEGLQTLLCVNERPEATRLPLWRYPLFPQKGDSLTPVGEQVCSPSQFSTPWLQTPNTRPLTFRVQYQAKVEALRCGLFPRGSGE